MQDFALAQLNIAKLAYPLDSPQLKDFVDNLDLINTLAERSDGFIWRLQTPAGDATEIDFFGPDIIVNMSVWRDAASLKHFVYNTVHKQFLNRREEWFTDVKTHSVLWWLPGGVKPTIEEASEKLNTLNQNGATKDAFNLENLFDHQSF